MQLINDSSVLNEVSIAHLNNTNKYYVTVLSNFARAYDKYSNRYSKTNIRARFPDQFFVLDKNSLSIGIEKNNKLLIKNGNPKDQILILETTINESLFNDHATGLGHYIKRNSIRIENCYLLNANKPELISNEDAMAFSLSLQKFKGYNELHPRSVSFLPIAKGCQASCSFCFSKASVSDDIKAIEKALLSLEAKLIRAKNNGAERAVITGGGEPTLLPEQQLLESIVLMKKHFQKIVLITNSYWLTQMDKTKLISVLQKLEDSGLTVLAISHHHFDNVKNTQIMNLDIDVSRTLEVLNEMKLSLVPRLICVLQKGGIETEQDIEDYLVFAAENNVAQVCFKELYVSTSTESYYHKHMYI